MRTKIMFGSLILLYTFDVLNAQNNVDGVISWKYFLEKHNSSHVLSRVLTQNSEREAFEYVNYLRQKAGMISLTYNTILAASAKNHAQYLIINNFVPGHYEAPGYTGFTGEWPVDRALYAGYNSKHVLENLSAGDEDYKGSVEGLFSAIYHRLGFLDLTIDEIGVGAYEDPAYAYKAVFVYNMGNTFLNTLCMQPEKPINGAYYYDVCRDATKKIAAENYEEAINTIERQNPSFIIWPPNDFNDTTPVFYEESPDPLPNYSVTGYPVSIQFNPYYYNESDIKLIDFQIMDEDGQRLDAEIMNKENDPNHHFTGLDFAIFPIKRLDWGKKYHVEARFIIKGAEKVFSWDFMTRTLPYPYYKITTGSTTLHILPDTPYALYFEPQDPNDKFNGYSYSASSKVQLEMKFIDLNTLYIKASGNIDENIIINLNNGKTVQLVLSKEDNALYPIENQREIQINEQNISKNNMIEYLNTQLQSGWNLVGAMQDFNCSAIDVNYTVLWTYDNGQWKGCSKNSHIMQKLQTEFQTVTTVKKGQGFWIYRQ